MVDTDRLQLFFFKAMLNGWIAGTKPNEYSGWFGSQHIGYSTEDGRLLLRDCWFGSSEGGSSGTTTIWDDGKPVWIMHYGGRYEKRALPFLMTCLSAAYKAKHFFGGRGPATASSTVYLYRNRIELSSFSNFKGEEEILEALSGRVVGSHWYHGMLLG